MKFCFTLLLTLVSNLTIAQLPKGFVYVQDSLPDLNVELRYCYDNNFVGEQIEGYINEVVIVTAQTVDALKKVQADLKADGFTLKVFDAYRPQRAVNHFVRWAKQVNDTMMKTQYYPKVNKRNLFKEGYIASKSRHSSGSTLDVTIVNLETGEELDMGSPYDFFGPESWVSNTNLTEEQIANRQRLQKVMLKNGFRNYSQEWWHFTLKNEPFKNQYFDFLVE
ncbi:D-Ala-D-Ala dipeptidase [Mesoflavibacter sp. HG96]|uniref:D-alanyl-D-alanine dipeptidase n=1 Tax=Mesoflavibacter profundi TaxID=2708110 RepID=A0ABT4RZ87_9FLAO|nr:MULTISPECIES: M15 family metallopeptidase [Mesoflavibacter]MDA0177134.1 M15 family metallopeptidase [Mesoflavibacter profundi]QIJ88056.1 D-Ala-D-Ala dipeptidase [Mesoflavibacter sp. HG96]QIJ90784.1 D-Ala-D-Ala dipeptidase [Mesoflavibacter sp. HG37]